MPFDANALFGVYVHWPYCASKCPYCDFNSHVAETVDHEQWRAAYASEIAWYAGQTPGRRVTSVFFGGGTPSLMEADTVASAIETISKCWALDPDAEITLEANPTSVEAEKFRAFRNAGINRVSIGVQALEDKDLSFLGRTHSAGEAVRALEIASGLFERWSFDLIYARPGQTVEAWDSELRRALSFGADHLSLYQLTIEEGTPFHTRHARGEFTIPSDDAGGSLYELTQEVMDGAGLPAYEISNHARPGQESLHNMTYWRYGDYAGIGPGAHGRLTIGGKKAGTRGHRAPAVWLKRALEEGHGAHPFEFISPPEEFTEAVMMGLRLREGIAVREEWEGLMDGDRLETLVKEGFIERTAEVIRPTRAGMQRLNAVLAFLLSPSLSARDRVSA